MPLFVLDPRFLGTRPNRERFLLECLVDLDRSLTSLGGRLFVRQGSVVDQTMAFATSSGCSAVFIGGDVGAYARRRERELDRLARNLEDHAAVRAALRKAGVQLHSVTESLEDSASGKLVEGILASIAEFYSANLGQEIRKGMDQKAAQGGWPVRAPFGYRNVRRESSGRRGESVLEPDQQAPLVVWAFERYATGSLSPSTR